ncbi:MAG: hypothetical protein ACTHKT_13260 [Solirubrobacterales bacterium]
MHKKLMMACMAIAAFAAFVIAPAASASPVLTEGTTAVLPHNTAKTCTEDPTGCIIGTNTGVTKFTASGFNVECDHDVLTGWVTKNSGTKIEGTVPAGKAEFHGTGTGTDCTSALGPVKVTVTSELCLATGEITTSNGTKDPDGVTVTGCGANVKFDLEITGTGNCEYSTASVLGTYLTNAAATVNISEQAASKVAGGIFCPSSGKLDMDFDLYTDNLPTETPLTIS